jgi:hypothetical protein
MATTEVRHLGRYVSIAAAVLVALAGLGYLGWTLFRP